MNQKQISIIKEQLTIKDGHPVTTSLKVAEAFDKRHDNVLRDAETLNCSDDFRLLNFEETVIYRENPSGGKPIPSKVIELTKDGFIFLVMGYVGRKAARIKEAYISAFNAMEAELNSAMSVTKAQATDALLEVFAKAGNKGYPASFLPDLVRYRRMGLSCEKCGKLLDISSSAVSVWGRLLQKAGVVLGSTSVRTTAAFFKPQSSRQLSLFPEAN
jgi:Rha family phage regulatory protein